MFGLLPDFEKFLYYNCRKYSLWGRYMKILPISVLNKKGLDIYSNKSIDNNKAVSNSYGMNVNQVSFAGNNTNFNTFEYGYSTEELKDRLSPKKIYKMDTCRCRF